MTKKALNILLSLIILIPIVLFFGIWDYYAVNIPKWDDHALKSFIIEYAGATDWQGKLSALVRQHNEHRIALTRLFAWLDFSVFGSLNYRHLMVAGNLLLLLAIPIWYGILKDNKKPYYALIPVPFLWLSLALWENMYWGMASIQNFGVVTLSLWSIYLSVNKKFSLYVLAILLGLLAVFTSPNGILALPVSAVLLFLTGNRKRFALWILSSGGIGYLYFLNYIQPESNPESKASLIQLVKGYMAFLGSFAESFPVLDHFFVCIFMGTVLFLVSISIASTIIFRVFQNNYQTQTAKATDLFCLGTIMFVLGTTLVVVYGRAGFGLETLITSRYKIYSVLLLITCYIYLVIPIRGSFLSPYITGILALSVTFNVFSYHYHLVDVHNLRKMLTMEQFNWTYTDKSLVPLTDTTFAGRIVTKSPIFYQNWPALLEIADRQGFAGDTKALTDLYQNTDIKTNPSTLTIQNSQFSSQRLQDSGIYIVLSSKDRFYVFPANRTRNTNRKQLFLKQYYFASGFHAKIPFDALDQGDYKVGLLREEQGKTGIYFNNTTVSIPETAKNKVKVNW